MTQIGSTYGTALYELAAQEQLCDVILQQLKELRNCFAQEPDFLRLLSAHNLPKQERISIADTCLQGKVEPYVLNFLKLLTEKGHANQFDSCVDTFEKAYYQEHGILPVVAVSAVALTQSQVQRLEEKLSAITGKKAQLSNRVEPECLGGIRLDYDGTQVDGSIANRINAIGKLLKNTVL